MERTESIFLSSIAPISRWTSLAQSPLGPMSWAGSFYSPSCGCLCLCFCLPTKNPKAPTGSIATIDEDALLGEVQLLRIGSKEFDVWISFHAEVKREYVRFISFATERWNQNCAPLCLWLRAVESASLLLMIQSVNPLKCF